MSGRRRSLACGTPVVAKKKRGGKKISVFSEKNHRDTEGTEGRGREGKNFLRNHRINTIRSQSGLAWEVVVSE